MFAEEEEELFGWWKAAEAGKVSCPPCSSLLQKMLRSLFAKVPRSSPDVGPHQLQPQNGTGARPVLQGLDPWSFKAPE